MPRKQRLLQSAKKMRKPAKVAVMVVAQRAVKLAVTANAAKVGVMAAAVDAMVAVVSAAKVQTAKSVRHAKVVAVVKAETNCVRAKPVLHAVSAVNVANAQSVLLASAHPVKVAARAATKVGKKRAAMRCLN
jgi:hypothetical protein